MDTFSNHYVANNNEEAITFELKVQNDADSTVIECLEGSENLCKVQYRLRYTPSLFDVSPSNVYLDQTLNFRLNPMAANYDWVMKGDAEPVDFIKLSGTRTDSEGLYISGDRLSGYTVSNLKSRSGDQAPGDSIPEVRFRVGNAHLRESAKHCNFAGDECWYVRTHPKIEDVSATTGYTTGG